MKPLADTRTIRVPRPLGAVGAADGAPPFLVLETIDPGRRCDGFSELFGRRFADLHRAETGRRGPDGEAFGFDRDNYIGATPQPNGWCADWCDFWRRRRLGHQLRLARERGLSDRTLDRLGDRLLDRLEDFLGEPEEPAACSTATCEEATTWSTKPGSRC